MGFILQFLGGLDGGGSHANQHFFFVDSSYLKKMLKFVFKSQAQLTRCSPDHYS